MPTYLLFIEFTDQGRRAIKQTVQRSEVFRQAAERAGVTVRAEYWTLGRPDIVIVADAADERAVASLLYTVEALGNARGEALPAFEKEAMEQLLAPLP